MMRLLRRLAARDWTVRDYGPGWPAVRIRVRRVYSWEDRSRRIRLALLELQRSLFGHMHDDDTIRFQHLTHRGTGEPGYWAVNKCRICGRVVVHGHWSPR